MCIRRTHYLFGLDWMQAKVTVQSCQFKLLVGGPGVKPGFAASDATVSFGYTTHPSGTRAGSPTRISSLGPKRHHALDHASRTKSGRDAEN